jgi:hypothetical protein
MTARGSNGKRGLFIIAALILFSSECISASAIARTLPRLTPGQHLGYKSFAPVDSATIPTINARIDEALAAGMDVGRVHLSWNELEPTAGTYDLSPLRDELESLADHGVQPMLTLGFTDSEVYSVPADLMDPVDPTRLKSGLHFDDAKIIKRFTSLLERIMPLLQEHRVWLISLANEPNVTLSDLSASKRLATAQAMEVLIRAARSYIRSRTSRLAVSVTLGMGGFHSMSDKAYAALVAHTDVVTFNYACINFNDFTLSSTSTMQAEIDNMLAVARGRPIVIQELSCHSGYAAASPTGATSAFQQAWLDSFFAIMRAKPKIRAAFMLDLVDWPEWLADETTDPLRDEGLPVIADRYEEHLRTWGLLRFDDGSTKPAWTTFLDALGDLSQSGDAVSVAPTSRG